MASSPNNNDPPEYQGPLTKMGLITNNRRFRGDRPSPGPHRCYLHYLDIFYGLTLDPMEFREPCIAFWKCMRSEEGKEPPRWRPLREQQLQQIESKYSDIKAFTIPILFQQSD
ncbi:2927_t:CDS:2, partial [Cetraspora pellucida]